MARIGYGFYAGVPDWLRPFTADGAWQVLMDPNEHNPFGHGNVIGRVPPGGSGDWWEHEFIQRGAAGGEQYGAYCQRWWDKAAWVPLWLGPNEPPADTREDARLLTEFYRGFAGYAHAQGRRVLGGNFSRGRPDEGILDGYVEMARVTDGLAFHEYGLHDMRAPEDFGWHCFRYRRLLAVLAQAGLRPDVYITELGLDLGAGDPERAGWQGRASVSDFAAQLAWYAREASRDAQVQGLVDFHGSSYSFRSFGATPELAQAVDEINRRVPASPPSPPAPKPQPQPGQVTAFSQRDPRWREAPLGTGGGKTIGQAGCLVSAMASALTDLGLAQNPATLNEWLRRNGGFAAGNLFVWGSVRKLGAVLVKNVNCRYVPAPVGAIRAALAAGQVVLAQVDALPGGQLDQHWVRVLGVDADGRDADIMDPWQLPGGELVRLAPRYTARGWNVARALFAVAIYRRV